MKVILVAVGGWGDIDPYLALSKELLNCSCYKDGNHQKHQQHHHNTVHLFVQSEYIPRIKKYFFLPYDDESNNKSNINQKNKNFQIHALPFTNQDFYKVIPSSSQLSDHDDHNDNHDDPKLRNVKIVAEIISQLVYPCGKQIIKVALDDDNNNNNNDWIIVTCALSRMLCILIAKILNIPAIIVHLQPLAPNHLFPLYRISKINFVNAVVKEWKKKKTMMIKKKKNQEKTKNNNVIDDDDDDDENSSTSIGYEETYWLIDQPLEEVFLKERTNEVWDQLNVLSSSSTSSLSSSPPPIITWVELQSILGGHNSQFWIVNAYSNKLIPSIAGTKGVGKYLYEVGPLADNNIPINYKPNQSLIDFLRRDNRPICIGFGSMPFHKHQVILEALVRLNQRAVLVGKSLEIPESLLSSAPDEIQQFVKSKIYYVYQQQQQEETNNNHYYIPYSYLLPHCSMMLNHGGAGAINACLRAGIPCLVSPLMGDQFMFASLVQAKGLGLQCGKSLSEITVSDIIQAVRMIQQQQQDDDNYEEEEEGSGGSSSHHLTTMTTNISKNSRILGEQIQRESLSAGGDGGGGVTAMKRLMEMAITKNKTR